MVDVKKVALNIYMIDNRLFSIPHWGSVYLIDSTKKALVECGPSTSIPSVLEGIETIGIKPEAIDYLIVTHIHLDHAGGAGVLIKHLPNAQIIVHPKGAPHLIDPERLVAGAIQARGHEVIEMHGEVVPVDEDRIRTVDNGEELRLGKNQTLKFLHTLGHAPHHICIHESENNGIFTGDAVALNIADHDILLPYHPPPQYDLHQCLDTLKMLKDLSASTIYYSHFGVTEQVDEHIERVRIKLMNWDRIVHRAAEEGTFAEVKQKLVAQASADLEPMKGIASSALLYDYFIHKSIPMSAEGHLAYYRKLLNIT